MLDELTTGLDPQARRDVWDLIEGIRDSGVTIVLVTHFMEEAERLCDRLALIDSGRVVAIDSPAGRVSRVDDGQRIRFRPSAPLDDALLTALPEVTGVSRTGSQVVVAGTGNVLHAVTAVLARNQIIAAELRVEQTSLDDAFVALTGRKLDWEQLNERPDKAHPHRVEAVLSGAHHGVLRPGVPDDLLVILGSIPAFREPSPDLGARVIDLYTPIVIAMSVTMLALGGIPQVLATYRERGILRRMATTPVHPVRVLAAQVIMSVSLALVSLVLVVVIARVAFGVALPRQIAGYAVAYGLTVLAMVTIGLLIAALAPSGKGAGAIGNIVFFPLLFFAGLYLPRAGMPDVLRRISDFTPLGAGVQAMEDAASGGWPQLVHIGVMLIWTIGAAMAAARFFRWE